MAWQFLDAETPFGFAHRGGAGTAPENTTAAFAEAVALGYQYLETDVHRAADGVLVAFHDDGLERVAGLSGVIGDYTSAELSEVRLVAGATGAASDSGTGHPIPTLTELLETFPESRFNIDPKADDSVDLLIETIRDFNAVDRVCIGSFSDARIERVQAALGPDLCTSPGPKGVARVFKAAVTGRPWASPYGCVQIPPRKGRAPLDTAWLIGRIKRLGLQVHYWTINTETEMRRLLDNGADAIITDEIALLKDVLQSRGEWSGQT